MSQFSNLSYCYLHGIFNAHIMNKLKSNFLQDRQNPKYALLWSILNVYFWSQYC